MTTINQFIDPGSEVDHANPPSGHIFIVDPNGGFLVDNTQLTGIPFIRSFPLISRTDKHYICDAGNGTKTHINLNNGFEKYADAYAHGIESLKNQVQAKKDEIQVMQEIIAHREANKP